MLLSMGAFKFSHQHLEFNTEAGDLHREFHWRRLGYGNATHVNVTVLSRSRLSTGRFLPSRLLCSQLPSSRLPSSRFRSNRQGRDGQPIPDLKKNDEKTCWVKRLRIGVTTHH